MLWLSDDEAPRSDWRISCLVTVLVHAAAVLQIMSSLGWILHLLLNFIPLFVFVEKHFEAAVNFSSVLYFKRPKILWPNILFLGRGEHKVKGIDSKLDRWSWNFYISSTWWRFSLETRIQIWAFKLYTAFFLGTKHNHSRFLNEKYKAGNMSKATRRLLFYLSGVLWWNSTMRQQRVNFCRHFSGKTRNRS